MQSCDAGETLGWRLEMVPPHSISLTFKNLPVSHFVSLPQHTGWTPPQLPLCFLRSLADMALPIFHLAMSVSCFFFVLSTCHLSLHLSSIESMHFQFWSSNNFSPQRSAFSTKVGLILCFSSKTENLIKSGMLAVMHCRSHVLQILCAQSSLRQFLVPAAQCMLE